MTHGLAETRVGESRRLYGRAPILEAVVDIGARLPSTVTTESLRAISWQTVGNFGEPQSRVRTALQIDGSSGSVTTQRATDGWVLTDESHHCVVQARLDGFSFSRLAPYDRWENFHDSVRNCWELYRQATQPLDVVRLALRYVNRLDLPLPFEDFREYLQTYPEVARGLPQSLSSFLFQLQAPLEDIENGMLILHEGIVESTKPDVASILLDIDVFQAVTLASDSSDIWAAIDRLHAKKNEVFEACITDKTRELIF